MPIEPLPSRNPLQRFVSGSMWLLAATVAIFTAVQLLLSIWVWLVLLSAVTLGLVGLINWWRWRSRGW